MIATILILTLLKHEDHNDKSTAGIKTTLPSTSTTVTTSSTTGKMQILKSCLEKNFGNFLNFSHKDRLPTRIDKCRKK